MPAARRTREAVVHEEARVFPASSSEREGSARRAADGSNAPERYEKGSVSSYTRVSSVTDAKTSGSASQRARARLEEASVAATRKRSCRSWEVLPKNM